MKMPPVCLLSIDIQLETTNNLMHGPFASTDGLPFSLSSFRLCEYIFSNLPGIRRFGEQKQQTLKAGP